MKLQEFPEVQKVERLSLAPNDTLVLTCPGSLSQDTAVRLREHLEKEFPGIKVLILADGLEIKVIRSE